MKKKTEGKKIRRGKSRAKVGACRPAESDEVREMRESVEEMERELAEMDKDIAEAEALEDPEMREVAVSNMRSLKRMTAEMIASNRTLLKTMEESEALMSKLAEEGCE